jgi:hypothetical protein
MLPKKTDICAMYTRIVIVISMLLLSSCSYQGWQQGICICVQSHSWIQEVASSSLLAENEEGSGIFGDDQKPVTKNLSHRNQEGVVEVVMKVDQKGQWKVVNMAATNEELAKYVLSKLKDYSPQTNNKTVGQVVKYRFVFKKQA